MILQDFYYFLSRALRLTFDFLIKIFFCLIFLLGSPPNFHLIIFLKNTSKFISLLKGEVKRVKAASSIIGDFITESSFISFFDILF